MTALHHAAIGGQEEAVRVLMQGFKVDPKKPDVVSISRQPPTLLHMQYPLYKLVLEVLVST